MSLGLPVLLLPVLIGACFGLGPQSDLDRLESQQEVWQSRRPARYSFVLERQCFCGPNARGPVRLVVDGEVVMSQTYVEDGAPLEGHAPEWFPTVDGLFEVLRDAYERGAHTVEVTFDPELGFPVDFWIDYEEFTADEELGFVVTERVTPAA